MNSRSRSARWRRRPRDGGRGNETFASSPIFIALTTNSCGGDNPTVTDVNNAFAGFCSNIGNPNLSSAKPKTITGTVTGAVTGRIWIANAGTQTESFGVQVTLTR